MRKGCGSLCRACCEGSCRRVTSGKIASRMPFLMRIYSSSTFSRPTTLPSLSADQKVRGSNPLRHAMKPFHFRAGSRKAYSSKGLRLFMPQNSPSEKRAETGIRPFHSDSNPCFSLFTAIPVNDFSAAPAGPLSVLYESLIESAKRFPRQICARQGAVAQRGLSPGQGRQHRMAQIWPERFGNSY